MGQINKKNKLEFINRALIFIVRGYTKKLV